MPSKFILWGICHFAINNNWADTPVSPYMYDFFISKK